MTREGRFYELFIEVFSGDSPGLFRFVEHLPEGERLIPELPGRDAPLAHIVSALQRVLTNRARIDADLFNGLVARFPGRHAAISAIAKEWEIPCVPPSSVNHGSRSHDIAVSPRYLRPLSLCVLVAASALVAWFWLRGPEGHEEVAESGTAGPPPTPDGVVLGPPEKAIPISRGDAGDAPTKRDPDPAPISKGDTVPSEVKKDPRPKPDKLVPPARQTLSVGGCTFDLPASVEVSELQAAVAAKEWPRAKALATKISRGLRGATAVLLPAALAAAQGAAQRARDIQGELDLARDESQSAGDRRCIEALKQQID